MKTICIIYPNRNTYSETFIHAHIKRLPGKILGRHGGQYPLPDLVREVNALGKLRLLMKRQIKKELFKWFLRINQVDVVLAEYGNHGVAVADVCQQVGIPLVVHFHGFDAYHTPTLESYKLGYQTMFKIASAVIAVSRDMEQQLLSLGAARESLYYNPYGVDPERFVPTNPAANPPLFVAVGRFVNKKAPDCTILAFRKVVACCPDARLLMIGDGPLYEVCRRLVHAFQLETYVTFAGSLPHHEVATRMQQARAFVQHSIRPGDGDSEGTPVAILEAGMSGLSVVSTRHAGIKDVVQHGETGFLVDEGDIDGMSEHMITLAQDASLAAEMGRNAHAYIREHFSIEQSIMNLANILEKSMKSYRERGFL